MSVRVHLNCAMSLDGCIGRPGSRPLKLSGPEDTKRVHELRAKNEALLVGIGTVLADDPKLTVKWELLPRRGKNPLRVVLDARLRTPHNSQVLQGDAPTLVFHGKQGGALPGLAQLATVPVNDDGLLDLKAVLAELGRRKISSLLVEGGMLTLSQFLRDGLVDEFTIYVAPRFVGAPDAPRIYYGEPMEKLGLRLDSTAKLGEGAVLRFLRA